MMQNETRNLPEKSEDTLSGFRKFLSLLFISFGWTFLSTLVIGCLASGIWTALPTEVIAWGSSKVNLIGYVSHCSWTPFSTLILLGASGIGAILMTRMPNRSPIGVIVFMCTLAGTGIGLVNGIDIITFAGMGAGAGVGMILALLFGLTRGLEL